MMLIYLEFHCATSISHAFHLHMCNCFQDIVMYPDTTLSSIYGMLGLVVPEDISKWVYTSMHASTDGSAIDTFRANATQTAFMWRTKLREDQISLINSECMQLIKELGYEV